MLPPSGKIASRCTVAVVSISSLPYEAPAATRVAATAQMQDNDNVVITIDWGNRVRIFFLALKNMSEEPTPGEAAIATTSEEVAGKREIGDRAVWSLSSCKQGFGVTQLRDGETTSYWQCV